MALPVSLAPFKEVCRFHNWNSPKGIELQQIQIPANDTGGIFAHGKLQKFVVVWIATGLYLLCWIGESTPIDQRFYESTALFGREVVVKFLPGNYLVDFLKSRF